MVMIRCVSWCNCEALIRARDAQALEEDGEIAPTSHGVDTRRKFGGVCLLLFVPNLEVWVNEAIECRLCKWAIVLGSVPQCGVSSGGVGKVNCSLPQQVCKGRRTRNSQSRARNGNIDLNIGNDVLLDPRCKVFTPFRATNETILNHRNCSVPH